MARNFLDIAIFFSEKWNLVQINSAFTNKPQFLTFLVHSGLWWRKQNVLEIQFYLLGTIGNFQFCIFLWKFQTIVKWKQILRINLLKRETSLICNNKPLGAKMYPKLVLLSINLLSTHYKNVIELNESLKDAFKRYLKGTSSSGAIFVERQKWPF